MNRVCDSSSDGVEICGNGRLEDVKVGNLITTTSHWPQKGLLDE